MCLYGLYHGLVFLPVLLSLVGPAAYQSGAPRSSGGVETSAHPPGREHYELARTRESCEHELNHEQEECSRNHRLMSGCSVRSDQFRHHLETMEDPLDDRFCNENHYNRNAQFNLPLPDCVDTDREKRLIIADETLDKDMNIAKPGSSKEMFVIEPTHDTILLDYLMGSKPINLHTDAVAIFHVDIDTFGKL